MLEFRILGELDVHDDGRRIEFREGNDAALLTLLLLDAGRPLSVERIVDRLWPDDPPASARKIVQNSVSRLRRALGEERLETRGHAYVLHAEADEIDAARFERLVAEGRGADALHLWRGPPSLDAERFEELHLTALEQRLAADVHAGRGGAVAELETLVRRHPYRERLRALQMRALYAEGRQADALDAYRAASRTLRDDLGLEPGPELRELEQAILRQEVAQPTRPAAPGRRRRSRRWWPVLVVALAPAAALTAFFVFRDTTGSGDVAVVPNSVAVIDPSNDRIVGDVRVGSHPRGLAVGAGGVWVANTSDATVTLLDPQGLTAVRTYGVGGSAIDVAVDGDTGWVATDGDDTLVRIDARTQAQETFPLPPGSGAEAVAVAPGVVWAAGLTVYRVDPISGSVVQTPPLPNCCVPSDVLVTPHSIWTNRYQRAVRLDPHTLREQTDVELDANDLHLAYGYGAVWVSGWRYTDSGRASHVWKLDDKTGATEAQTGVGDSVEAIAVGAGAVWTANQAAGTVSKLDPKTGEPVATIRVGGHPDGIAVGDGRVWVSVSPD